MQLRMRSDSEWLLSLCKCVAVDPSTVRLDGGFRQLFHWIPRHMGPLASLQHVLEVMPLDVIVLSIALQCSHAPMPKHKQPEFLGNLS